MPRRLKVQTNEMGLVELYLIYDEGGIWETEWRALQGEKLLADQLPSVTKEQMDQALVGWTKPLVSALGPAPKGLLVALPPVTRQCSMKGDCPFYRAPDCVSTSAKMPWCFVPAGVEGPEVKTLAAECIRLWREGVYIVVVREPAHAQ